MRSLLNLTLCIAVLLVPSFSGANESGENESGVAELRIAVAANFRATAEVLARKFTQQTMHKISISSASTGALYNQILYGAPYDLFLSADIKRPQLLEEKSLTLNGSRYPYAYGRLVLWQRDGQVNGFDRLGEVKGKIALPDANLAPYGAAAKQALEYAGLWKDLQPRLVRGSSVQQSWQFVASGNANVGFVAWSQLVNQVSPDDVYFIPVNYHAPLEQELVILKQSHQPKLAKAFSEFIRSVEGQRIIYRSGYDPVIPLTDSVQ